MLSTEHASPSTPPPADDKRSGVTHQIDSPEVLVTREGAECSSQSRQGSQNKTRKSAPTGSTNQKHPPAAAYVSAANDLEFCEARQSLGHRPKTLSSPRGAKLP